MTGHKVPDEIKEQIVEMYLSEPDITQKQIAKHFGVSEPVVQKAIKKFKDMDAADKKHAEIMEQKFGHPRTTDWMAHITPLNKCKQELEAKIAQKQDELRKAQQEYRDFLATLEQLKEDTT